MPLHIIEGPNNGGGCIRKAQTFAADLGYECAVHEHHNAKAYSFHSKTEWELISYNSPAISLVGEGSTANARTREAKMVDAEKHRKIRKAQKLCM